MDYVAEALKSSAADALYKSLSVRGTITFDHNDAGTEWSSATINGATTIIAAPTNHPAAALYHELLHAKLKLDGYRQYLTIVSMSAKRRLLQHVCEPLDNELQHHRMIGEFLAAGFPADQFYNDEDVTAIKESRRALQGLKRDALPEEFLLPFLTVLAPGGVGSVEDRQRLNILFRANSPRLVWQALSSIEECFAAWSNMATLDAGETIVQILRELGYDQTWIGVSQDFPDAGKFVVKPFTIEEAQAWVAAHPAR